MVEAIHIAVAVIIIVILLLLFFFFFYHPKPPQQLPENPSISKRMSASKTIFNWSDNPSLITDAIENGWSQFAFNNYVSSLSIRSNRFLLGSCAAAGDDSAEDQEMESSWEVCQGSADFMQKIRLNMGLKKIVKTTNFAMAAVSVIKSALPLPGPVLRNSSPFPQEAYFEITVLSNYENDVSNGKGKGNMGEGENIKLIDQENGVANVKGVHVNYEELRGQNGTKELVEGRNEVNVMISVGLTGGGPFPVKLPGSYPGSVGFNSDGSIYLDGIKLEIESIIERWEGIGKVIGCGYNPSHRKVFFTLDSKLIHEINCKELEEYGTPLYPTIAANSEVEVLINFGQSTFKYPPANLQRTQNPCFVGPMATSSSSGYEDSKELFSMGIDNSHWLNQNCTPRSGQYYANVTKGKTKDYDETSEGDLFEIVIESNSYKKSPTTHSLN